MNSCSCFRRRTPSPTNRHAVKIEILIDPRNFRRWHQRLRDRLAHVLPRAKIRLARQEGAGGFSAEVGALLGLEKTILRRMRPTLCDRAPATALEPARDAGQKPDVVIDLTGASAAGRAPGTALWRVLYDNAPGEAAAIAALLGGACPSLALEDARRGAILGEALPSLEAADGLTGGLEAVFSRVIFLIEQALLSPRRAFERPQVRTATGRRPAAFFARAMAHEALRRIYHLSCHSPHWRIGWRLHDGPGVLETGVLSGPRWQVLPDLGDSFAADPFPIEWRGQRALFYERLDYATNKGTIWVQPFDESGPSGPPLPALEEPWHLSYPFLIVHEGELCMVPEASASGAVSIYRCERFPTRWRCVGQLLEGVEAADATIFRHAGRFWMMSVVRDGAGGYSDTLAIHHAADLFGPWREHALRPVLIDSRLARPAGGVVEVEGALWRPVQDCSTGYGKKLALARIDALDEENFAQTRMSLISPGPEWPGARLHTLNRWGRLEVIDGAILTPKNAALRRMVHGAIDRSRMA